MGGLIANEREKEGYERQDCLRAALPMPAWLVDLEVERERPVTAAVSTVLALIHAGVTSVEEIARGMGMGSDIRLAERVLVKLLAAGAIDTHGSGFVITRLGDTWKTVGSAKGRERVTLELRLDPVQGGLEWVDYESSVYATDDTWTIELPPVGDAELLARKTQVGDLIRAEGLPDDEVRGPSERRPRIELRGLAIVSHRVHWREVRLDVWRHPVGLDLQIIGYIGDAENPPLTKLLSRHELTASRKRIVLRGEG